jgi:hypothetical protein
MAATCWWRAALQKQHLCRNWEGFALDQKIASLGLGKREFAKQNVGLVEWLRW